jgi:beta-N-acetylhexosaminidase
MQRNWKWAILLFSPLVFWTFQQPEKGTDPEPSAEDVWVDSVYNSMSAEERLGQLFMIRAHSDLGPDHVAKVERLIEEYHVGGLCFFQGTAEKHARLINQYQQISSIPLMIAIDGEWGLGMRLKSSTISFPKQLMLGAIQDNYLIYEMGREIARHCRRLGIHVNFAPVVDVNNNPENPVINMRSFGEDRYNVAAKGYQYMLGLQDGNVMACAKHFPGHGDTGKDSHYELPVIPHDISRLDSIEFFPFQMLIDNGLQSMMIAHLNIPALDDAPNRPTTVSQRTVSALLKKKMGFGGLIFTDALEMKGLTNFYGPGPAAAEALRAGNDVLLLPTDIQAALKAIGQYVRDGKISIETIRIRVKRILRAKYRLGLIKKQAVKQEKVREDLNRRDAIALKRKLIEASMTLVRDKKELVPLKHIHQIDIASLSIGHAKKTDFQNMLHRYIPHISLYTGKDIPSDQQKRLLKLFADKDLVIVSLQNMSEYASRNFGLSQSAIDFIHALQKQSPVLLTIFGNPYALNFFDDIESVLVAYMEEPMIEEIAAQAIMGVTGINGRLPVTASTKSRFGDFVGRAPLFRLGYDIPERVGLNTDSLQYIDSLMAEAIEEEATPGAIVLAAKDGRIVFRKAYGHHTYRKERKVQIDDIYDLASITKVAAATLAIMRLYERGQIDLFEPISTYLPELDTTDKKEMILYDILAHRAGLVPWIPFYEKTVLVNRQRSSPMPELYHKKQEGLFNIPVTASLYMRQDYVDTIWQEIRRTPLRDDRDYRYSDLGFYFIAQIVHRLTGMPLDQYVEEAFYQPMGLREIGYQPWKRFPLEKVPPTEKDNYFRNQYIQGYVHDMGAAMLGGVSGHAGLFSKADDLAAIFQMLLNGGYYGGQQFLQPTTIDYFTTRHKKDLRRGLGFDMKQLDEETVLNMSPLASTRTFGHLGFTGTCVWADPQHNLIYIVLTNRTWPSMKNYKWGKNDYRPRIQSVIYRALMNSY